MRICIIITHFATSFEHRNVLLKTLQSIKKQHSVSSDVIVCVVDDGSFWSQSLLFDEKDEQVRILSEEEIITENILDGVNCNSYILHKSENHYNKAKLLNLAVKHFPSDYYIVLDDDHPFISNRALVGYEKYFSKYDFVVGRLLSSNLRARRFADHFVQGTNFGISSKLLEKVGGFGEYTRDWGRGEDSDIFYKAFKALAGVDRRVEKAVYAGDIITIDICSGRWQGCDGGEEIFKRGFNLVHGVDPFNNDSRLKSLWFEQSFFSKVLDNLFSQLNSYPRLRRFFYRYFYNIPNFVD